MCGGAILFIALMMEAVLLQRDYALLYPRRLVSSRPCRGLVFSGYWLLISGTKSAIVSEGFHNFPQSLKAITRIVYSIGSFPMISYSSFMKTILLCPLRAVHMGFVVNKVSLGWVILRVVRSSPVSIIQPLLVLTRISSGEWTMGPIEEDNGNVRSLTSLLV
jgi:hypothetical protein